jgi:prepilin-type N-terminal cleavage/methylation domain-containing protein
MRVAKNRSPKGFTLPEILITMGIMAIVGLMIFLVLNSGMVLYAKNTAVNSAHQQARSGVDQMLTNIHGSVSIPYVVDTSLQAVASIDGNGQPIPAAGISFQTFSAGPFPVAASVAATATSVVLYCPSYVPPASARLNIPSHNIEYDVTSTAVVGANRQFNLATPAGGIGTAIGISGSGIEGQAGVTYIITAFLTARRSYAVVGSELRYFPTNDPASYKVISRNITSPTPFTIPLLPGGAQDNRFVAAANLSAAEPNFANRGYAAVNMFINSTIPFRCRLTNTQ